ncbi:MAG: hypothetical protein ABI333_20275 [bacterium]
MIPHVVSCPVDWIESHRAPAEQVFLRAPGDGCEPDRLAALLARWRSATRIRRLELPFTSELDAVLQAVGPGLRVVVEVDRSSAAELHGEQVRRWEAQVNLWAAPRITSRQGILEAVTRASLAGWPVQLPAVPGLLRGGDLLLELLEHYLFEPALDVPVEPLHSLLVCLVQRQRRTLWNLWFGVPEDHFYLTDEGHVSLCEAWAGKAATRYGTADEEVSAWRSSAAYQGLLQDRRDFPRAQTPCAECPARRPCAGVLLALDPALDCGPWQELFERLRLAAGSLQRRNRERNRAAQPRPRPPG